MADRGPSERSKAAVEALDEALVAAEQPPLDEQFPDASQTELENAQRLDALRGDVVSLAETIESKRQRRKAQVATLLDALQDRIEQHQAEVTQIALAHGDATDEEKQRVKEARRRETNSDPDDMAAFFDTGSERGGDQ